MFKVFLSVLSLSLLAFGHTNAGETSGLLHGFSHPIGGADHLLAMFAVGLFAAQVGGRSLILIPLSFVSMMLVGAILGINGVEVGFVEEAILASVVAIGALVAFGVKLPMVLSALIIGSFALFHGVAHGAEMPLDANGALYALGFISATSLIHLVGIVFSFAVSKILNNKVSKVAGIVVAASGVALASM